MTDDKDWVRVSALRAACALHAGEAKDGKSIAAIRRRVLESAKQFEEHLTRNKD